MGQVMKVTLLVLCVIGVLFLAWLGFVAYGSFSRGYTWSEMDWDHDGKTTIGDFLQAADIGKRAIEIDGKACTEYFALKDGLPVKTTCP